MCNLCVCTNVRVCVLGVLWVLQCACECASVQVYVLASERVCALCVRVPMCLGFPVYLYVCACVSACMLYVVQKLFILTEYTIVPGII